jgi:hypothetical protein
MVARRLYALALSLLSFLAVPLQQPLFCLGTTYTKSPTHQPTAQPTIQTTTLTALVYAHNYFEFYVNGVLIKQDPLTFTPIQASQFDFTVETDYDVTYAIKAKDWADVTTGYVYMNASDPAGTPMLGTGGLRVLISDGTASSSEWKCFTTAYGPNEGAPDGCSSSNFDGCTVTNTTEPDDWQSIWFDDSDWSYATEYTEDDIQWPRVPTYSYGACHTLTDPWNGEEKDPSYIKIDESDCLDPSIQNWGNVSFIWKEDLDRDNTILCRLTIPGLNGPVEELTPVRDFFVFLVSWSGGVVFVAVGVLLLVGAVALESYLSVLAKESAERQAPAQSSKRLYFGSRAEDADHEAYERASLLRS